MRLILSDSYYIDVDDFNWTLKKSSVIEEYTDKNGKVIPSHITEKIIGYYGNFADAVEGALKHNVGDLTKDMVISMPEFVKAVENANKTAVECFKKYGAWVDEEMRANGK